MRKLSIKSLLLIIFAIAMLVLSGCSKEKSAADTFAVYKESWQNKDYEAMYDMLSTEAKGYVSKEDFVQRYTKIYSGIEAETIEITVDSENENKNEKDKSSIPFSIDMKTAAGDIKIEGYTANLVKEKVDKKSNWLINWDEKMIFPQMVQGDKVRIDTLEGKRGEIYDAKGNGLAVNSTVTQIGIYPKNYEANKAANTEQLAKILDINPNDITEKLAANTNPEYFVPIVTVNSTEREKISAALAIDGVIKKDKNGRTYNGGEAFGALIGYIGNVTAEELEANKDKGYTETSLIGKRGLEQVYEDRLKAKDGAHIYISRESDNSKIDIAKTEPKDGEKITISIDSELQKKIYESMNGEKGASTVIDPKTGAVLAMVSSPSFDPNSFTTYVTQTTKAKWDVAKDAQFENRFKKSYAPGSTFKLFTAIAGLEKSAINPEEALSISGTQWQPNASWGDYKVTRVTDTGAPVTLKDAFVYSDNIYFSQVALKLGKDAFIEKAKAFGIGEELPIDYPIVASQISADGSLKNDIALADSSYGQGQVLMTPLQLTLMYSAVVNDGKIMSPTIESKQPKVWKENLISAANAKVLADDLKAVIEEPSGTAHSIQIPGVSLAGKTGTAELKKDANDTNAEENGWFVVMNTDNPKLVMATMMENVKSKGGSHFVLDGQKKVLDYYFAK